jgi:hypothetical protein
MPPKKHRSDGNVNDMGLWLSSEQDEIWIEAAIHAPPKTSQSNSDKNTYQTRILNLEGVLISNPLCPSLNTGKIIQTAREIQIPTEGDNKFYLTTVSGDDSSCHAILVYVKTNDNGKKTVYCYDPAGNSATHKFTTRDPAVIKKPSVKTSSELVQINTDMCPSQGINPEGYCALWSIVVVILWDLDPELDFHGRLSILKRFNALIAGGIDDEGREIKKVPGLRKWFIATVYHFIMQRGEYYTTELARLFIIEVQGHIRMTLSYHSNPSIREHVAEIALYVDNYNTKKRKLSQQLTVKQLEVVNEHNTHMLDKVVDMYFKETMEDYKKTLAAAAGGGAAAAAVDAAAVDAAVDADGDVGLDVGLDVGGGGGDVDLYADAAGAGGGGAAADAGGATGAGGGAGAADGGGLRRVRSLRHKNKMYRSKKVRKPRRTVKRRSRRSRRN